MTLWAEEFKRSYPNVNIQIRAAGSSTAPPALTEGTANMGPMSRPMKDNEIRCLRREVRLQADRRTGGHRRPRCSCTRTTPSRARTSQVDGIFSSTRLCGGEKDIKTGRPGLTGEWASKPIQLFGRNSVSGTYGYFKEEALCKGDFKSNVNEQPGSASVVQSISSTLNAIGYSGIGYKPPACAPYRCPRAAKPSRRAKRTPRREILWLASSTST